jgi:hypothetical protein
VRVKFDDGRAAGGRDVIDTTPSDDGGIDLGMGDPNEPARARLTRFELIRLVEDRLADHPYAADYRQWARTTERIRIGTRRPAPLAEALCEILGLDATRRHMVEVTG